MKLNDLAPDVLAKIAHLVKSETNPQGADPDAQLPIPTGFHVLCLQYVRPEKSRGGIILAETTRREDSLQGRVGIVLALGKDAYTDEAKFPTGPWCKVGDVIAWPPLENVSGRYAFGGAVLCAMTDDRVVFTGVDVTQMVGR